MSCKLVCKLWNSLISCSDFASSFITNHAAVKGEYRKHIIIVQDTELMPGGISFLGFQLAADMSTWSHESSCFTTTLGQHLRDVAGSQKNDAVCILASYNDLLLCASWRWGIGHGLRYNFVFSCTACTSLFLCNPFTMERLDLPKPPIDGAVALMCEPYYHIDAEGRYRPNSNRGFTVVCVSHSEERVSKIVQFCSEIGAWSKPVGLELRLKSHETNIVAYKGKFYWVGEEAAAGFTREHVVVYDPSSGAGSATRFSCFPEVDRSWGRSLPACFGVCNGVLRVMRLFSNDRDGDDGLITLCVWELKDNNGNEKLWSLEKCIASDQMISQDDNVLRIVRCPSQNRILLLAFDPSNEEIVYMTLHRSNVSCNLRTRNLEVLTNSQPLMGLSSVMDNMVFSLAQPWWPTPIRS